MEQMEIKNMLNINKMFPITSLLIKTDVTCSKLINDIILVGIGGQLHIFKNNAKNLLQTIQVFEGQKIYGIELNSTRTHCLLYGGKKLKVYSCNIRDDNVEFTEEGSVDSSDWVLTAKWIDNNKHIVTVLMHNIIIVWTAKLKQFKWVVCEEKCILYSAHIVNETWDELIILSGTVFSEILIWWPKKSDVEMACPVLYRLCGHKGVIFSIDYNPEVGIICSTSDDRSARLWFVSHKNLGMELLQTKIDIKLKYSLFAHDARVFRCKVLNNYVLTAGEDSLVNIWTLEGKLFRKFVAHQGACIWSIDASEHSNEILAGGSNAGVTLFPLKYNVEFKQLLSAKDTILKKVVILRNNDVATISEMGILKHYRASKESWIDVANHNNLKSYALLQISSNRTLLALAGFHGNLYIYQLVDNILQHLYSHELPGKSRIFAFHWLSDEMFMICASEGLLSLWALTENDLECVNSFQLPPSKERWTTAACICADQYIAVGDRKGNIYLYSQNHKEPLQTIKRAHNYLGITNLCYKENTLTSLGRNSIVKNYNFDVTSQQLTQISSDKVPFTWLAAMYEDGVYSLLLSFSGDEFIIWDYKKRRLILKLPCGGGHRSWDFHVINGDAVFVYIKGRTINSLKFDLKCLQPLEVFDAYHMDEINSLLCLKLLHTNNQCLLISGGEDTTLRISKIYYQDKATNFVGMNVFKSHLSSIRCIKAHKLVETSEKSQYLIFSGGGRAQIIIWELNIIKDDVNIREKLSYYEQIENTESEIRIMDACTISTNDRIIFVTVCSDGTLKTFLIDLENDNCEMAVVGKIFYRLKCILKVFYVNICERHIILSMATDGEIVFWDFTKFVYCLTNIKDKNNHQKLQEELSHIKSSSNIKIHQSGINSFTYKQLSDNLCVFLSGGDDNAIIMNLINLTVQDENIIVKVLYTFQDISSHCAQITGVFLMDKYFVTTSIDQKLNIFNWNINKEQLKCVHLQKYNLSVSDIQGIQCYEEFGILYATVYGKGIEFCKVQMLISPTHINS